MLQAGEPAADRVTPPTAHAPPPAQVLEVGAHDHPTGQEQVCKSDHMKLLERLRVDHSSMAMSRNLHKSTTLIGSTLTTLVPKVQKDTDTFTAPTEKSLAWLRLKSIARHP